MEPLSAAATRVEQALAAQGLTQRIRELPASTRSAAEAAAAIGCTIGQIAKSLVFRLPATDGAILVIASGTNQVDVDKVAALIGTAIDKADADFVRRVTGFAIGGIPPCGHAQVLPVLIDEDLLQYDAIWAAAGTPHAVFPLSPLELVALTGGRVSDVARVKPLVV
jgi:prolyl-tRNA editing enzyme YbaK/EbsC (Cys-tRNA(Pro) deacylase)